MATVVLFTCDDNELATRSYPSVDTKPITVVDENGARFSGEILTTGSFEIIDHGFVYNNFPNPNLANGDRISLGKKLTKGPFSSLADRNLTVDRTYYVRAYATTNKNAFTVYGQEVKFVSQGGAAALVEDFYPKQGSIGDTVILLGSGFSNTTVDNIVKFSEHSAMVFEASEDSLWCLVPPLTPVGENQLEYRLDKLSVTVEEKFVLKPIEITSFTPLTGTFSDTVTIKGNNFPTNESFMVTILGKTTVPFAITRTQFKVSVPKDAILPQTNLTLTAGAQTVTTNESFQLRQPIVTTINPMFGTKDTEITITGDYFSPLPGNNEVKMNNVTLLVVSAARTSLKVKVPPGMNLGKYNISVKVATQSAVSTEQFEIITPAITDVSPLNGTWGNTITITGQHFANTPSGNIVTFDDAQATLISASSTEIRVLVPNSLLKKSSTITVRAVPIDNRSATFQTAFQLDAPTITSFTPEQGKSRSQVTLTGQNFNPIAANNVVKFGDHTAQSISATSSQLTVQLPTSLIDGNVDVQVTVAEQTAAAPSQFKLISPWRRINDYPDLAFRNGVAFTIDNVGYVTLGQKSSPFTAKTCWRYDPTLDQWSQVQNFSLGSTGGAADYYNQIAFSIDNIGYVGVGRTVSGSVTEYVRKYSPTDNTWTGVADLTGGGVEGAVAYSIDGKGYVISGVSVNGQFSRKIWEYNPSSNSWIQKTDLAGIARSEAAGFSIGSKAYVIGGRCNCNDPYMQDVLEYNAANDTGRQLSFFPGPKRMSSTGFSINGTGYILGGMLQTEERTGDFWKYEPATDTWTRLEDFPGEKRSDAVVFIINGKAYFGSGLGIYSFLRDFWEFDPSKL